MSKYLETVLNLITYICEMIQGGFGKHTFNSDEKLMIDGALMRARSLLVEKIDDAKYEKQTILPFVDPCTGCEISGCKKPELCHGFVYVAVN